jgi:hypothetical protein
MESIFDTAAPAPPKSPPARAVRPNTSANTSGGAVFEGIAWSMVIFGAFVGTFILFTGMATATGAPQEAVVCALAVAVVVLPYCAARAVAHLRRLNK